MKHPLLLFFMLISLNSALAQRFEVGGFVGGANYIGDVGNAAFINPNGLVIGGIAKWNQTPRHSFRLSLLYADINADDTKSNEVRRQQRGYTFNNHVAEASLGLEFNFWQFDLSKGIEQSTPYLYTGITYFNSDHQYLNADLPAKGELEPQGDNWAFSIPMVFGYKQTITKNIIGAVEVGARYTFTDNMDGSNPQELLGRRDPPREFGNTNTKDWYVFSGLSLTFTFGQKPCYCR